MIELISNLNSIVELLIAIGMTMIFFGILEYMKQSAVRKKKIKFYRDL